MWENKTSYFQVNSHQYIRQCFNLHIRIHLEYYSKLYTIGFLGVMNPTFLCITVMICVLWIVGTTSMQLDDHSNSGMSRICNIENTWNNWFLFLDEHLEESFIKRGDWGCNGPNDRDDHQCRVHCRTYGYRNGQWSIIWNYTRCVCVK